MRWHVEGAYYPERGATRICEAFLWLPKTIKGEARWFEPTQWEEQWVPCKGGAAWVPSRWLP